MALPKDCPSSSTSFAAEIMAFEPFLRNLARRYTQHGFEVDDLVQETICKALAKAHLFKPGTNLKAWLGTILKNLFLSEYRLRQRERIMEVDEEYLPRIGPSQEWAVRFREATDAIEAMSPRRRTIITRISLGDSYDEVAHDVGCEVGTIKAACSGHGRTSPTVAAVCTRKRLGTHCLYDRS
jgi:RNA polymerase sigma-70 factor (ECF subfamily)